VETLFQRKIDKKITVAVLIMQRLAQNDPSGYLLEEQAGRWRHVCLPGDIHDVKNRKRVRPAHLVRYYRGGLLDPVRLDDEVLAEKRDELKDYGFACQFDQYPIPRGGGMFQVEKIAIETPPPMGRGMVRTVRYWDKAATPGDGTYTVGFKMGLDNHGYIWMLDIVRGKWDTGTREMVILQTAAADGQSVEIGLEQEPGSGGKESAEETVKRLRGYRTTVYRPHGNKTIRADPWSSQVNYGLCKMAPGPWNRALLAEMQFFPYSKYKDQVDGGSGAFTMLANAPIVVGAL
jgi:predicted phage terminase large subunit-like protein